MGDQFKPRNEAVEGSLIRYIGDDYLRQFIAFCEINNILEASWAKEKEFDLFNDAEMSLLSKAQRKELVDALHVMGSTLMLVADKADSGNESFEIDFSRENVKASPDDDGQGMHLSLQLTPEVSAMLSSMTSYKIHKMIMPKKDRTTNNALIATIVSAFEVLLGSIAREALSVNKAALEKSGYEFTLEELSGYASIEEARSELINRRVEALLMGSVETWMKWYEKVFQIQLPSLTADWPEVREIFARRNVIVHDAGRANRRYCDILKSVSYPDLPSIEINSPIETNSEYVDIAAQRILSLGLSMLYAGSRKLYPARVEYLSRWFINRQSV